MSLTQRMNFFTAHEACAAAVGKCGSPWARGTWGCPAGMLVAAQDNATYRTRLKDQKPWAGLLNHVRNLTTTTFSTFLSA